MTGETEQELVLLSISAAQVMVVQYTWGRKSVSPLERGRERGVKVSAAGILSKIRNGRRNGIRTMVCRLWC